MTQKFTREFARALCYKEDWQGVLNYASDWCHDEPKNALAIYYKAIAFKYLEMVDKAELLYKDAISIDPKLTEAWFNLGIIANEQKRFKEAETFFTSGLKCDPKNLKFILDVARFYAHNKEFKKSANLYREAQQVKPYCKSFYGEYCQTLKLANLFEEYFENIEMLKTINSMQYKQIKDLSFFHQWSRDSVYSNLKFKYLACDNCKEKYEVMVRERDEYFYYSQCTPKVQVRTSVQWCRQCNTMTQCEDLSELIDRKKLCEVIKKRNERIEFLEKENERGFFSVIFDKSFDREAIRRELDNQRSQIEFEKNCLFSEDQIQKVRQKRKAICLTCNGDDLDYGLISCNVLNSKSPTNKICTRCNNGRLHRCCEWDIRVTKGGQSDIFISPADIELEERYYGISNCGEIQTPILHKRSTYRGTLSGVKVEYIKSFINLINYKYDTVDGCLRQKVGWYLTGRIEAELLKKQLFGLS